MKNETFIFPCLVKAVLSKWPRLLIRTMKYWWMKKSFSRTVHTNSKSIGKFSYSLKSNRAWIGNTEHFVKWNVQLDHREYKDRLDHKVTAVFLAAIVRLAKIKVKIITTFPKSPPPLQQSLRHRQLDRPQHRPQRVRHRKQFILQKNTEQHSYRPRQLRPHH